MSNKIEELKENLPKECCSFCTHLSLEGPDKDYKYNIKCIMLDSLPKSNKYCDYFQPEYSSLTSDDLDNLYTEFLEACLRINYKDYLNSIHWQIFKDYALSQNNHTCSICGCKDNIDVHHSNKNRGRETLNDVIIACNKCISKL